MRKEEKIGRLGAFLDPRELIELIESVLRPEKIQANAVKAGHEQEIHTLEEEKEQVNQEKKDRGSPALTVIMSKIKQEIFLAVLVIVCVVGEYIYGIWFIGPFDLGNLFTVSLAMTFMIVLIKAIDFFLSALETKWPQHCSTFNLVLGSINIIIIFSLIFMAANIRELVFQTTATLKNSTSSQEIVGAASKFFGQAFKPFRVLMVLLSSAITLIGGITYHRVKDRLFALLVLRGLHKRGNRIDMEILRKKQEIAAEDARVAEFAADIQLALAEEKARRSRNGAFFRLSSVFQSQSFGAKAVILCFLILAILGCGLIFSGVARGEVIGFLDMTDSSEVRDYAGKETEHQKNVHGIERLLEKMPPGEVYRVFGITGKSFSARYLLLEGKMARDKGVFGENIARDRLAAITQWKKLDLRPIANSSDVFGAIHLASILFADVNSKRKNLLLYGDMREYGKGFDFESPSELRPEALLGQVKRQGKLPSLNGVKVWCLGVHASGKTPAYWESLRSFWEQYFKLANAARLCAFTMEREINIEEF